MSRFLDLFNSNLNPQPEENENLELKEDVVESPESSLPAPSLPKKSKKRSRK